MSYEVFNKALSICEEVLGAMSLEHKEAYDFSQEYYSTIPSHLETYILNDKEAYKAGTYEKNLLRFVFIKSIENRIASDLYSDTERGNVCDVFFSPVDMDLDNYPTNLPLHLEQLVNRQQQTADFMFSKILESFNNLQDDMKDVLLAVFCYAQEYGYHLGQENSKYKSYNCSDMLTRNELTQVACNNVCSWLENHNFKISEVNHTRDTYQNIVALLDSKKYYILLSAEIAPTTPGFRPKDFENLFSISQKDGALPCIISVSLRADDETHFNDGVILAGDKILFMINGFQELFVDASKSIEQRYLTRDLTDF